MQYTTILTDLDETIFDFRKTEYVAITRLMKSYNIEPTDENVRLYSEINDSKWHMLERKEITREKLFVSRFDDFFDALNIKADTVKVNEEYISYVAQGGYFLDGALETIKKLSEKYKIYIITNGSKKAQTGRLSGSPLLNYVEDVFISEDIGHNKPQKEYFDYVLENITEKDKSKILVVGDSLQSDIAGAVNSGLDSCWVNRKGEKSEIPTYEIKSINDIFEIL